MLKQQQKLIEKVIKLPQDNQNVKYQDDKDNNLNIIELKQLLDDNYQIQLA